MAVALAATPSAAATLDDWEYVGSVNHSHWFLKKSDVGRGSVEFPEINVWTQVLDAEDRKQTMFELQINCRTQAMRYNRMISDWKGDRYDDQLPNSPMKRPIPGSVMEDIVGVACA